MPPSRPQPADRPSSSAQGYGGDWRRLRARFLTYHPTCEECGAPASDVDHVIPKRAGGPDEWHNLQALCHSCHSLKTNRERRGEDGRKVGVGASERSGPLQMNALGLPQGGAS